MYDAVVFDLDGTLCRSDGDAATAYRRAFEAVGREPFAEPAALWAALDGQPDPDDRVGYLATGFARLAAQHNADVDPVSLASALIDELDHSSVRFRPGAERVLTRLASTHRLGLLTNGPERYQRAKVESLALGEWLDAVVYAGDLPRRKPLSLPFETACERLAIDPERTLYVGDSLEYDVAGAHTAGIDVAWIAEDGDDPGAYRPTYRLDSLPELLSVLE